MNVSRTISVITYDAAERAVAAAIACARAKGWSIAVAVCDPAGGLVAFARLDGVPLPIVEYAIDKAFTAATLGKSTKSFGDRMASAPTLALGLSNRSRVLAWAGGLPIEAGGQTIGGVGVSGAAGAEDEECAEAALKELLAEAA